MTVNIDVENLFVEFEYSDEPFEITIPQEALDYLGITLTQRTYTVMPAGRDFAGIQVA